MFGQLPQGLVSGHSETAPENRSDERVSYGKIGHMYLLKKYFKFDWSVGSKYGYDIMCIMTSLHALIPLSRVGPAV